MKQFKEKLIVGIDHGYGNIKTANHCFKTGVMGFDAEPLFTKDMLEYDGRYYLIGEGHKEFLPDKIKDEDYYLLTLVAIAEELKDKGLTEADVIIAAGLPLTWTSGQKNEFAAYLSKNEEVSFTYQHTDYHVRISGVKIYPQGYAAVAEFVTTMKGLSVVADIGNGTMNTLFLTNGRPMSSKMYTEKFGTYQCTLAIREEFIQKWRTTALEDEISRLEFAIEHSYDTATVLVDTLFLILITVLQMVEELMSPDLRHEARNIERYVSDYRFLQREEIHTIPQLEQNISDTKSEIADLELERSKADNTRRRAHSPEKVQAAKDERKAITEKIRPLREKVKRAEKIMEKSPHLYELLQSELDVERQAGARARNKNKEWSR